MIAALSKLAWTEILFWVRRRSVYAVTGGIVGLVGISVAVAADDLTARRQAYADQLASIAREQVKPKLPMMGWSVERVLRLPRPPELGSIVVRGDDIRLSPHFDFGPAGVLWGQSIVTDTAQTQAGALFDVESILRVLGGLLALLLGIEVIGVSRFRGQLDAWHALGLDPRIGVAGKLIGCAVILVAGCVIVLVVTIAAASSRLPDDVMRLAPLVAVSLVPAVLYLWVLTTTGAAVALWSRTLAGASMAGVAVWVLAAMIGPQVSDVAGHLLAWAPQRAEFERDRQQAYFEDIRSTENALGEPVEAVLGKFRHLLPAFALDAAVKYQGEKLEPIWVEGSREARRHAREADADWMKRRTRQITIDRWLQTVTPGASLVNAVAALAGTGPALSRAWYEHVESHQNKLNQMVFDDRPQPTVRVQGSQVEFPRHAALKWSDLPAPPEIRMESQLSAAAAPLAALLFYFAIAMVAVALGARRLTTFN